MIRCSKCKRITKAKEPTGYFTNTRPIIMFVDGKKLENGTKIISCIKTCYKHSGEKREVKV